MRTLLKPKLCSVFALVFSLALFPAAWGLECANAGTAWVVPPDDAGDANSTACGDGALANGPQSTAIGVQSTAPGTYSAAFGPSANAGGSNAVALGFSAYAQSNAAIAMGQYADAAGSRSLALGSSTTALRQNGIALGAYAFVDAYAATAIGFRAFSNQPYSLVLGSITGVNSAPAYTKVAIGTTDPQAPLHIFRGDATQEMLFLESDEIGVTQDRAMMYLANNGGIRFEFANNSLATSWRFQAATGNQDRFEVTKVGTGQIEFWIDDLGNGFIAGDLDVGGNLLTNLLLPSDADHKRNIETVDLDAVLEKIAELPVSAWEYTDRPGERHIGPMAQDFQRAFGLGAEETSISVVDASGVALASIKALVARNRELEQRNDDLEDRVEQLEALFVQGLARAAQN